MAGETETLLILEGSERTVMSASSVRHCEGIGMIGELYPHLADAVEQHTVGEHRPALAALLEHRAIRNAPEYVFELFFEDTTPLLHGAVTATGTSGSAPPCRGRGG